MINRIDQEDIDDILDVANFLYWSEEELSGGIKKQVAWEAFCSLIGIDEERLKEIVGR